LLFDSKCTAAQCGQATTFRVERVQPINPAVIMTTPKVKTVMITIVIIEPPSKLSTNGCTWPLRGSKYQKTAPVTMIKATPQMMENMFSACPACAPESLVARLRQPQRKLRV